VHRPRAAEAAIGGIDDDLVAQRGSGGGQEVVDRAAGQRQHHHHTCGLWRLRDRQDERALAKLRAGLLGGVGGRVAHAEAHVVAAAQSGGSKGQGPVCSCGR
jgi:hypothetical protein